MLLEKVSDDHTSFFIEYSASFDPDGAIHKKEHKSDKTDVAEPAMTVTKRKIRQGNVCYYLNNTRVKMHVSRLAIGVSIQSRQSDGDDLASAGTSSVASRSLASSVRIVSLPVQ